MKYKYIAVDIQGKKIKETIEAEHEGEIVHELRSRNLILVSAKPIGNRKKISLPFLNKVSLTEKLFFIRHLRIMISSGLSLFKALDALERQTKSSKLKNAIVTIKGEIKKGRKFSDALSMYPEIFSEFFTNMIRASEESGTTEEVLGILANQIEKEYALKSAIKGALIYPAVILLAMTGIGMFMITVIIPQMNELFIEMEMELPRNTQFIITIGTFLANNITMIPFGILGFIILFTMLMKTKIGKKFFSFITLKIPILSAFTRNTNSAHTSRTLSSLLNSGTSITRSLEIVSNTLKNTYFKEATVEISKNVKKGEDLSKAMIVYENLFSPLIPQMVKVGEETGETSELLLKAAEFLEEEVERTTKNLTSIIEPILMIFIGGTIGFFALSILQPMYTMLDAF